MNSHKNKGIERQPELDDASRSEMLAVLVRNQQAFEAARDMLKPEQLDLMGQQYVMLWRIIREFYEKRRRLPLRGTLRNLVASEITNYAGIIDDEESDDLDEFLTYAFDDSEHGTDLATSAVHRDLACDYLRRYMTEYYVRRARDILHNQGGFPLDAVAVFNEAKAGVETANSISARPVDKPFAEGWDKRENVKLFPTGCQAIDEFTGGWRGKEVFLFMAPIGTCKTTLCCHAVSESIIDAAKNYSTAVEKYQAKKKAGKKARVPKRPVVVLAFVEGEVDEYRCRIMAHMASIPLKRLQQMGSLSELSSSPKPAATPETAYEKKVCGTDSGYLCEQDRVKVAVSAANQHLIFIDCSGNNEEQDPLGLGGVRDIAARVNAHFRANPDSKPSALWLDHLSALVDRMASANPKLEERLHREYKLRVKDMAEMVAKPWNIPCGVLHQLKGAVNNRRATATPHHADGLGSSMVAEYAVFAITSGTVNDQQLAVWRATKHRRESPKPSVIVQVDGAFQKIILRNEMRVSPDGMTILHKNELEAVEPYDDLPGASMSPPET